jgi:glycosyltransferase involved in cell wall biosynthesis
MRARMTSGELPLKLCAIVPVYDHEHAIGAVIQGLRAAHLPCLVIDDGSGAGCARVLDGLAMSLPGVTIVRRASNGGKGAAVSDGLRAAMVAGYTHALQVDADGQHDLADIPQFLATALAHPDNVICGRPRFDATMPRMRYYLRYLTHFFVWVNTLSLDIHDSMCGFRLYPIAGMIALLDAERMGSRMDFDIEVLVRLHWRGVAMRWIPTRVQYPADGISHFRMIIDNALITRLHIRLFFGMLLRLPAIAARRLAPKHRTSHA